MKAVLLDAGGTMVFPNFRRIAEEFAKDGVLVSAEELARAEARIRFEIDRPDVVRTTADAQRWANYLERLLHVVSIRKIPFSALRRLKAYHDAHNLWDLVQDEVPAALEALGRRYRLGVVSNSNGTVRALLERLGLARHFETVVDSHEERLEKPDPRLFRVALERMGLAAGEAAYVGDLYYVDVEGARAAGLHPILLDPMGLYADKPVTKVRSLMEVAALELEPSWRRPLRRRGADRESGTLGPGPSGTSGS